MLYTGKLEDQDSPHTYKQVGTLCDEPAGLTCSFDATRRWGKAEQIIPFPTFEDAALATKNGDILSFVVPAAYPQLSYFIMDSELVAQEAFIIEIPPLVAAGVTKELQANVETLFYHPATMPLFAELPFSYKNNVPVTSNSRACVALLEEGVTAAAITNRLCASFYKLTVYKVLRPGIKMPFICFVKASENNSPEDRGEKLQLPV